MSSDNPLPVDNSLPFDIIHFEDVDMDLPTVTGAPTKTILVPAEEFGQVIGPDRIYVNRLEDPTDLFNRGVEIVNLTHDVQEFMGYGDPDTDDPIVSFPAHDDPDHFIIEAADLPDPRPDRILIPEEHVLKDVMAHLDEPGSRTVDDLAYPWFDCGFGDSVSKYRSRFLVSATLLRLAPYEGSFLAARIEMLQEALEEIRPLCSMRGLVGRPSLLDFIPPNPYMSLFPLYTPFPLDSPWGIDYPEDYED